MYILRTGGVVVLALGSVVLACSKNNNNSGDGGVTGDGAIDGGLPSGSGSLEAWCMTNASSGSATPGASLEFDIDICKGPTRQYQPPSGPTLVPAYIYGINAVGGDFTASSTKFGLIRQGGDDNTAYNWTNDYSNSGADYCYFSGASTTHANLAGRYIETTGDTIATAQGKNEAFLATVSLLDFVAASYDRNTGYDTATMSGDVCPGTDAQCSSRSGSVRANVVDKAQGDPGFNAALTFAYANDGSTTTTGSSAFVHNVMKKGSTLCSCPVGTKTCTGCSVGTNPVAQDEFVNFLKVNYGSSTNAPVFFDLDNEPNFWVGTHPETYPNTCSTGKATWDDITTRNINAATAVKSAWNAAKVFGPVVAGDGMVYAGDYGSSHFVAGTTEFTDWYLQQVVAASVTAGKTLLDVLDVHYYTVGGSDAECLESPRLFWDPNATDISAAETNSLDFDYGDHSYWDMYWYPRKVIPRLFTKIATAYQGTAVALPGLSFSEYNPGCENAISGGVAEADLLGIFGREGVFAATAWPLQTLTNNYLVAAFALYRGYDGNGAVVGDATVHAITTDAKDTSVYAFVHGDDATQVELVAINKQSSAAPVTIKIASSPTFTSATLYHLVGGNANVAKDGGTAPTISCSAGTCSLTVNMPAVSATTIVLR